MGTLRKRNRTNESEKPKGKPRKLRDSAAKLARYTREEARHTGPFYKGSCGPQSCLFGIEELEEVACVPFNTTDYYCLCTSNGLPPTRDYKCPRSTVPVTPKPIHNIIPPTTSNTSAESRQPAPGDADDAPSVTITRQSSNGTSMTIRAAPAKSVVNSAGPGDISGTGILLATTVIGAVVLISLVIIVVFFYVRRRLRSVDGKTQPVRN